MLAMSLVTAWKGEREQRVDKRGMGPIMPIFYVLTLSHRAASGGLLPFPNRRDFD